MITAFKLHQRPPERNFNYPKMSYIRERLQSNYSKLQSYYRFNNVAVRSDHILVTLLNSLLIPPTTQREHAYDLITRAAYSVANGLGIGSSIYTTKVQTKNWFYGDQVKEIIYLAPRNPFSVDYGNTWKDANAIKVIAHPKSDLTFRLLNGKETSSESGYAVIEIDAALLHWQYRQFKMEQQAIAQGTQLSVTHFVAKYVLPNMLKSHLDVAFFNRFVRYNNGQLPAENQRKEPLALPTSLTFVDEVVGKTFDHLAQSDLTVTQILTQIPLPFTKSMFDFLLEPDTYADSRNIKAYRIARALPALSFALSVRFQATESPDKVRNELLKVWLSIKNERVFNSIRDGEFLASEFEQWILPFIGA